MQEDTNMKLWNAVSTTKTSNTKKVDFGRKFTAIDAYSQIEMATKMFGSYGSSWGLKNIQRDLTSVPDHLICIAVFYYPKGEFELSTSMKTKTQKGFDVDVFKKIETELITKALSRLGFNADVFLGRFDDQAYVHDLKEKEGNHQMIENTIKNAKTFIENGMCEDVSVLNDYIKTLKGNRAIATQEAKTTLDKIISTIEEKAISLNPLSEAEAIEKIEDINSKIGKMTNIQLIKAREELLHFFSSNTRYSDTVKKIAREAGAKVKQGLENENKKNS